MAAFICTGFIEGIRPTGTAIIVTIAENRSGYKKSNGEKVEASVQSWVCIFKPYFKKFITEHFNVGNLVEVKGDILPYTLANGEENTGYSVIGQTINLAPYPKNMRLQKKAFMESQRNATETPNLEAYNEADF